MRNDLKDIKEALLQRIEDLCRQLLPRGRLEGGLWVTHNPLYHEKGKTPTFKVRVRGGDPGAWRDWRSGDKGDVIGLVAHCLQTDIRGALAWSRGFLGWETMSLDERRLLRSRMVERSRQKEREDEKRRNFKLIKAHQLWMQGTESKLLPSVKFDEFHSAEGHAINYFQLRNCPLQRIPNLAAGTFRFSLQTEWWKGAKWRSENGRRFKEQDGPTYPAIHSAMRNHIGILTACHVTFLDPIKPRKAPVDPAKLMFGFAKGSVIELAFGPEPKPFWEAHEPHPVILTEGIETGLSIAMAVPEARIWACGSLSGIGSAPVDLRCVGTILFARDNNTGNSQAQKQFEQAMISLEESGKPVRVMASHVGDDFNDLANGEDDD